MEITYTHAAGLDVHKKTVVACLFTPAPNGKPQKETRTFGTMTQDLLALADWLTTQGVIHVAMESTAHFWRISTKCFTLTQSLSAEVGRRLAFSAHFPPSVGRIIHFLPCLLREW